MSELMNTVILFGLLLACVYLNAEQCKIINCVYYNKTTFTPEQIDPTLCTHLTYRGFWVYEKAVYPNSESSKPHFPVFVRLNALKKKNPQLKLLWTISPDSSDDFFFIMYRDAKLRREFIQATINFIRLINFDGVEFMMTIRTGSKRKVGPDNGLFVTLLQEMSLAFSKEGLNIKKPPITLALFVPAKIKDIETDYDVVGLSKHVDFLIVNTAIITEKDTRYSIIHQSPLYGEDDSDSHSLDYFVRYLISKGIEKQKIVIGLNVAAVYYILTRKANVYDYYPRYYNQVCGMLKNRVPLFDEVGMIPYCKSNDDGLMYNDQYSLRIKVIYMKSHGLGGVFISMIVQDDFTGACNKGKFPLLSAINDECRNG